MTARLPASLQILYIYVRGREREHFKFALSKDILRRQAGGLRNIMKNKITCYKIHTHLWGLHMYVHSISPPYPIWESEKGRKQEIISGEKTWEVFIHTFFFGFGTLIERKLMVKITLYNTQLQRGPWIDASQYKLLRSQNSRFKKPESSDAIDKILNPSSHVAKSTCQLPTSLSVNAT